MLPTVKLYACHRRVQQIHKYVSSCCFLRPDCSVGWSDVLNKITNGVFYSITVHMIHGTDKIIFERAWLWWLIITSTFSALLDRCTKDFTIEITKFFNYTRWGKCGNCVRYTWKNFFSWVCENYTLKENFYALYCRNILYLPTPVFNLVQLIQNKI